MSINMDKINKLNDLVTAHFRRKHIIVLNPEKENETKKNENAIYDEIEWKIPAKIQPLVKELEKNKELSNEDKILSIYEELCMDYIYDDNILSYIKKIDDDSYALPDWYGREIDHDWEKNREEHNRRVCYEVSRYLAKSITDIFKENEDYNVCILWDKSLTHYFVGLTCEDYSIILDLDNFNNIKDLTRLKAGLTAEGIEILQDRDGKFGKALNKYNKGKHRDALKKMEDDIDTLEHDKKDTDTNKIEEPDSILFLKNSIEILKNKHGIDSQGIYEYIKEIIDITLGPEKRKKVWKEIKGNSNEKARYIRCLILDVHNKKYVIDVDQMLLRAFDEEELKGDDRDFIPYKELLTEELIDYRSRKEERYSGR